MKDTCEVLGVVPAALAVATTIECETVESFARQMLGGAGPGQSRLAEAVREHECGCIGVAEMLDRKSQAVGGGEAMHGARNRRFGQGSKGGMIHHTAKYGRIAPRLSIRQRMVLRSRTGFTVRR